MAWAHPKFGVLLASCSYDSKVSRRPFRISEHFRPSNPTTCAHDVPLPCASVSTPFLLVCLRAQVMIHRESPAGVWTPIHVQQAHESSVNSVAWAPHE